MRLGRKKKEQKQQILANVTPTIVACIDTGSASPIALRYACYKAKKFGFAVQILVVIEAAYKNLLFVSEVLANDKRLEIEKKLTEIIDVVGKETGVIPSVSIREGEIVREIVREIKSVPNCTMLVLGKSHNSLSDNRVLPRLSSQIGDKILVPIVIIPENLSDEYLQKFI